MRAHIDRNRHISREIRGRGDHFKVVGLKNMAQPHSQGLFPGLGAGRTQARKKGPGNVIESAKFTWGERCYSVHCLIVNIFQRGNVVNTTSSLLM